METISIYILKMECNFVKIKTIWGIFAKKKASQKNYANMDQKSFVKYVIYL